MPPLCAEHRYIRDVSIPCPTSSVSQRAQPLICVLCPAGLHSEGFTQNTKTRHGTCTATTQHARTAVQSGCARICISVCSMSVLNAIFLLYYSALCTRCAVLCAHTLFVCLFALLRGNVPMHVWVCTYTICVCLLNVAGLRS